MMLLMRPHARTLAWILMALATLGAARPASAGWNAMGKVNAIPPLLNEKFGCSVAVDGDWMAVGASDSTIGAARSTGAVHLFKNDNGTWVYRQSLTQENPLMFQAFGNAVALRGDTLVVGSWGTSGFSGRAFVYTRDGADIWNLTATLAAGDPQPSKPALFGWSLSLDLPANAPPVVAIGRPNDASNSAGAVYVFEFDGTTWNQVSKLRAPDATAGDQLGTNVSVRNGTLVAGASRRRRAFVFQRIDGAWTHAATLQDSGSSPNDGFGSSVASGGNFVAVGSPSRTGSEGQTRAGAVTVFADSAGSWRQTATITLETPRTSENFGFAIVAAPAGPDGRPMLVVGAPGFDVPDVDSGVAFAYSLGPTGWTKQFSDLWSLQAARGQFAGKALAIAANGGMVALSSELPRGSIGGAFPMQWLPGNSGTPATDSGSTGSGTGTSGGTGSGGGGSGSGSNNDGGDLSSGGTGDPGSNFGQGGRPRPLQPLPALPASFGSVTDTVIVDAGGVNSIMGLQIDGVQQLGGPEAKVLATYPGTWSLAATGDANGDASGDLIWQDADRKIAVWLRDGTNFTAKNTLRALAPAETIVASMDFDGDGVDDVVTRDTDARQVNVLRMRNGTATTEYNIALPDLSWRVVPHGRESGLLLRQDGTGAVVLVNRNLLTGVITSSVFPSPEEAASIEGMGDIDGNGTTDMVCRNPDTDEITIWRMNRDNEVVSVRDLGIDGGRWRIEAVRDWDGNGCDDLLLSRGGSGRLVVLYMHFEGGVEKILKSRMIGSVGGSRVVDVTRR
ncbi:MAG: hypothetical protein ACOYMI_06560 [Phycisphaerales bacterium]|jgi:hypothetical protein